jgi:GxxExxY protein
MNADERRFKHQETTHKIIGIFYEVYNELGCGFLESVYREAMAMALRSGGLQVEMEFQCPPDFAAKRWGILGPICLSAAW